MITRAKATGEGHDTGPASKERSRDAKAERKERKERAPAPTSAQTWVRNLAVLQGLSSFGDTLARRLYDAAKWAGNDILEAPATIGRAIDKYNASAQKAGEAIIDTAKGAYDVYDKGADWAGKAIRSAPGDALTMAKEMAEFAVDEATPVMTAPFELTADAMEAAGRAAVKGAGKAIRAGVAGLSAAAQDIADAPGTLKRAVRRADKAYDAAAQKAGEAIVTGAQIAGRTALEVGLMVPRTAIAGARASVDVAKDAGAAALGSAELVGMGMLGAGELMGTAMEKTGRAGLNVAKKAAELGVDAVNAAAQDIVDAPGTIERAGRKALDKGRAAKKAYDAAAQKAGEAIVAGAQIAGRTALEVGLMVPQTAIAGARASVDVAKDAGAAALGSAELVGMGMLGAGELMGTAMEKTGKAALRGAEWAATDVFEAPATIGRAIDRSVDWLTSFAAGLTSKKEKTAVTKAAEELRTLERRVVRNAMDFREATDQANAGLLVDVQKANGGPEVLKLVKEMIAEDKRGYYNADAFEQRLKAATAGNVKLSEACNRFIRATHDARIVFFEKSDDIEAALKKVEAAALPIADALQAKARKKKLDQEAST